MKKLLLTILLLSTTWSSAFSTDVIVTTNGDVTAGVSRKLRRAMYNGIAHWVLVAEDISGANHDIYAWVSNDEGSSWTQKSTLPFTGPFGATKLSPSLSRFRNDTMWAVSPDEYSGVNVEIRQILGGSSIGTRDTIAPADESMLSGLMRVTGDTLAYAYYEGLADSIYVVRSNGAWSQGVGWTVVDSFYAGTPFNNTQGVYNDPCGIGVAVWDPGGLDMYWFDIGNDGWRTIGTDIVPALLTGAKRNATAMACYQDSMVVVIAYLARDTCLWEYRWWVTGGTRKTGMTLIDSMKLLSKAYFSGGTSDSMSPMPSLMGTVDGDTATLVTRMWFVPSNADSIVLGYCTAYRISQVEQYGVFTNAMFDSLSFQQNNISFNEGMRYQGLCASRYINKNAMVFWQKGISTPDTIWCSYEDKMTYVIMRMSQVKTDAFSTSYTFQGTSQVEDAWLNPSPSENLNYGGTDSLRIGNDNVIRPVAIVRPLLAGAIPFPCHILYCSLLVKTKQGSQGGSAYSAQVMAVLKPPVEGTQLGADPGASPGGTQVAWNAANDDAAKNWGSYGASLITGITDYNSSSALGDLYYTQINGVAWTNWSNLAANTSKGTSLLVNMSHWHKAIRGDANALGWIRLAVTADRWVSLWSSEAGTSTDGPKFYFNIYFTEPGFVRSTWQQNFRRRYISPGFRRRII